MTLTAEQMRRALELQGRAKQLKDNFDKCVLMSAAKHYGTTKETILVGTPTGFSFDRKYDTMNVEIPEAARRHVFNLWRKDIAQKYNAIVRELNQIGMRHGLTAIELQGIV